MPRGKKATKKNTKSSVKPKTQANKSKAVKKTAKNKKTTAKSAQRKNTKKTKASPKKRAQKKGKAPKKRASKKATPRKNVKRTPKKTAAKRKPAKKTTKRTTKKPAKKPAAPRKTKAAKEKDAKIARLLVKGQNRGFVTYAEILREFPTIETDIPLLTSLYENFESNGVDILEGGGFLEVKEEDNSEVNKYISGKSPSQYDSIQMYLKEIGQYPLIQAHEEKELARRIEAGDIEAKTLLARANLRLVVSIAKKYVGRSPDLTLLD